MRWSRAVVMFLSLLPACAAAPCRSGEFSDWLSFNTPVAGDHLNSIFLFGGRMSTTTFGDTLGFNTASGLQAPFYDNYIVGGAYQRDFLRVGGFVLALEAGIADRFGNYAECCSPVVTTPNILNSGEFWAGPNFRYDGIVFFNALRVTPGWTMGFSATTNSIGAERGNEIAAPGSARFLVYLGPELAFSAVSTPQWELVLRVQHRSGAWHTFGNLGEGYNANEGGIRYHF
jgi:hypothetical protein